MKWTEEQTERLISLWKAKTTSTAIAKELGITRNAVMGKVSRLGLRGQGPPQQLPPHGEKQMDSEASPDVPRETLPIRPKLRSDGQPPAPPKNLPLPSDAAQRSFNEAGGCGLIDLQDDQCHWPVGDPVHDRDFCYCAAPAWGASSYCRNHLRVMYPPKK